MRRRVDYIAYCWQLSIHSAPWLASYFTANSGHTACCRNRTDEAAWRNGVRVPSVWILAPSLFKVLVSESPFSHLQSGNSNSYFS